MSQQTPGTAVVTGGNRGLGLEVCRQLSAQGYRVVLTARDGQAALQAAAGLGKGTLGAQLDVTNSKSIEAFAAYAAAELGPLAALVNNAGVALNGFDLGVVQGTLGVNCFGALHVTQALLPLLVTGGNVVMVSSGMGELSAYSPELRARFADERLSLDQLTALLAEFEAAVARGDYAAHGWPGSAYRVSKAALNALTRIFSRTEARARFNSVCPGWVQTSMGGASAPRDVKTGASGIVWAATLDSSGPRGGFFRDAKPIAW